MATLLWSSKDQSFKGVAVCPYCHSVTGFDHDDLENPKLIPKTVRGRRVGNALRGQLICANPDCQKQFEAECK